MEEGESKQENPQPLNTVPNHDNSSLKKPSVSVVDRLKRDEWSEGAVSSLLEAYETKWVLRNRAKLKGQDWEDVAKHVSSRTNQTKSPKTQTQCKNKIESMKKRYRSESATTTTPDGSCWPLYSRLDHLLRGTPSSSLQPQPQPQAVVPLNCSVPLLLLEPPSPLVAPPSQPQISHGSNGVNKTPKEDGFKTEKYPATEMDTDSSTPVISRDKAKMRPKKKVKTRRYREEKKEEEIAGSIRWLAEVVMRTERARMETMKEIEKMRGEAEVKRGEIDLKRTEIMANTQIEIARLFAVAVSGHKGVDSSLRIGRN
ncbi:hypothetical protein AALP_AA5G176400 [Arabis alpina]|uniref:Myb/SANT-like DNA-binding domain-containing protein n=1 Tax=Arabis alpina TaxID=50452 RepID=A0A087GXR9_ARAAL|nr:hypothetical protein AALP_AA5G176400 [Arabis alpina]